MLSEEDFRDCVKEGVWLIAEVGTGSIEIEKLMPMVKMAKKYRMKILMHCGGKSIPEGKTITAEDIVQVGPDVVSHINGGSTAPSIDDIERLIRKTALVTEIVYGGNLKAAVVAARLASESGALGRLIIGSDSPSGAAGLGTRAVMRTIVLVSALAEIAPERVIAMASGNTAEVFGLKTGKIQEGWGGEITCLGLSCRLGWQACISLDRSRRSPGNSRGGHRRAD